MNYKVLAFVVCVMPFACSAHAQKLVDTSFVPDKTNRAYTVMVEAGAKLLEFDIIRARVNAQEKALVATLQHETFTSTAGKALGVLGPLEQLAHGFDDVIPAFLLLQNSVTESEAADAGKVQSAHALQGLVALLAEPEVLHAVLPQPELVGAQYRDAMTYAPTATFVKTIQAIAHKKFMLHYCSEDQQLVGQQALPNDAHLFYGVIRQTVQNLFGDVMKVTTAQMVEAQPAEPLQVAKPSLSPQEMLHQAILHDSAEEVEAAVKAGADVNASINNMKVLDFAIIIRRNNVINELFKLGVTANVDVIEFALKNKNFKAAVLTAIVLKVDLQNLFERLKQIPQLFGSGFFTDNIEALLLLLQQDDIRFSLMDNLSETGFGEMFTIGNISFYVLNEALNTKDTAVYARGMALFKVILKRTADINEFWRFNVYRYEDVIKMLLAKGANPNYKFSLYGNSDSWTPLLKAVSYGDTPRNVVNLLLDGGADISLAGIPRGKNGKIETPLSFAQDIGLYDVVELLLERGASL